MSLEIVNSTLILLGFSPTESLEDKRVEVSQVRARMQNSIQYIANILGYVMHKNLLRLVRTNDFKSSQDPNMMAFYLPKDFYILDAILSNDFQEVVKFYIHGDKVFIETDGKNDLYCISYWVFHSPVKVSSVLLAELIAAYIAKTLSYSLSRNIQERQVIMDEYLRRKADLQHSEEPENAPEYLRDFPRIYYQ